MSKIEKLAREILRHKELYYQGKPEISDEEFDQIEESLRGLDPNHPALLVVGNPKIAGKKIAHDKPMLSLGKTYKLDELIAWKKDNDLICTYKMDGASCSLIYEEGKLVLGKTRGNGKFGEDISDKVVWIHSIPHLINSTDRLEIRGELVCSEENFIHLTREMNRRSLEPPKSRRNIVSGLLGRKDNIDLIKYIHFFAFEIIGNISIEKERQKLDLLKNLKFEIPKIEEISEESEISLLIDKYSNEIDKYPYLTDGLVFTFSDLGLQKELGYTAHHPRYKMAFKLQGQTARTIIDDIHWGVSRNGILTPVAQVSPVELSGAMISNVSLHNYGQVQAYNLKKGDEIEIVRSGEVIPKFLAVISSIKGKVKYPKKCPVCKSETLVEEIRLLCSNSECPARVKEQILNFIKKMNIEDFSSKRLEDLLNKKLIQSIPDLYRLKKEDLLALDHYQEKLATKVIDNIKQSKEVPLVTFLSALGITGGAVNKCQKIIDAGYTTLDKVMKITKEELMAIESFAEKSSDEFLRSFKEKHDLIKRLIKLGISVQETTIDSKVLSGKTFCITGKLTRPRKEIQELIINNGGKSVTSVSSSLDYLITNEINSKSDKFVKAKKFGVSLLTEELFYKMINL